MEQPDTVLQRPQSTLNITTTTTWRRPRTCPTLSTSALPTTLWQNLLGHLSML